MFAGCGTALVTPFSQNGSLDEATFRRLVRRQIDLGIDFLSPCGTTGESPTLTRDEHLRVVEMTLEEAQRGPRVVPVLAGAGGNNTSEVIALGRELEELGVDGLLSVTPYYNKVTQEGLYQHYKALADEVSLPIIVYNVPGRTAVNVDTTTLIRLANIPNIVGVKEASGNVTQMAQVCHALPDSFTILSGDDALTIPMIALGGHGVISVLANELPAEMTELTALANANDFAAARRLQQRLFPLMEVNFVETNPGPVKTAMGMMELLDPIFRLPMVPVSATSRRKIQSILESMQLVTTGETVHAS